MSGCWIIIRNDKKFDMLLTGVMDGCAWCEHHRTSWSDPAAIHDGFPITRSMEGLHSLWDKLDKNRNGELIRRDGDYSVRKGLCHQPVSQRDLFHFTICHKVRLLPSSVPCTQHLYCSGCIFSSTK